MIASRIGIIKQAGVFACHPARFLYVPGDLDKEAV
jgi:hypothetical protein